MNKTKHNIFHITIRPKNDLYREIEYEEMLDMIESTGASYCIAEEKGNHLHIAMKFEDNYRQDVVRKRFKKYLRLDIDSKEKVALRVKFHGDWEYLLGYLHKDGKILELTSDIDKKMIEKGLARYLAGDKAQYVGAKREDKKWMTYDEIIFKFIEYLRASKIEEYYEWAWFDFLSKNVNNILPSCHARIRKDPLIEYVNASMKFYKYNGNENGGKKIVGITKELPTILETTNDTTYIDDMFNDLT